MDKSRILKIILEAGSKIAALNEALANSNTSTADWTLLMLAGVMQDLQRLTEEEPLPMAIDRQKLSENFHGVLTAIVEARVGVKEGNYRLAFSDLVLLGFALNDIREIIDGERVKFDITKTIFNASSKQKALYLSKVP